MFVRYLIILLSAVLIASCGGSEDVVTSTTTDEVKVEPLVVIDSVQFFNDQVAQFPNNADWLFKRAVFILGRGNIEGAQEDLLKAIDMDSVNMDARLLYGNIQLSLTNIKESKEQYDFILDKDSTNTGALMGMSKLYALNNNVGVADRYISQALRVDPYLAEAYFMRGIVYRSDFYMRGKEESWDRAVSSFQTAVEQDPEFYSAYIEMGVMFDQRKDPIALEYYNSALDIYPESTEALYNVGMFHQTREEVPQAIAAYQKLNDIDSAWADPYYNQGYIHLLMTKQLDSAIFYLTKATDYDPEYFQAYNNLGLAYEMKGDLNNAKKYYGKAVEINPDFQIAKDNLNNLR